MGCGLCGSEQHRRRWYLPAVATQGSEVVRQLQQHGGRHVSNKAHPLGQCVSYAWLQERAAEGKQAEKDIPALTKCIEKLGEQLHQEEQVSPAASALF